MPTWRFAFSRGEEQRLEVRVARRWRGAEVLLDGVSPAAPIPAEAIASGTVLKLPDGSALLLQRGPRPWWAIALGHPLRVERDGTPLPGSHGDPRAIMRSAAGFLALLGSLIGLLGLLWMIFSVGGRGGALALAEGVLLVGLAPLAAAGLRGALLAAAAVTAWVTVLSVALERHMSPVAVIVHLVFTATLVWSWRRSRPPGSLEGSVRRRRRRAVLAMTIGLAAVAAFLAFTYLTSMQRLGPYLLATAVAGALAFAIGFHTRLWSGPRQDSRVPVALRPLLSLLLGAFFLVAGAALAGGAIVALAIHLGGR